MNYLEVGSTAGFVGFIHPRYSRAGSAQTKTSLHVGDASRKRRTAVTGILWLPVQYHVHTNKASKVWNISDNKTV